jgi:hypothetical protein
MLKYVARSPTLEKSAKRRLIFAIPYAIQIGAPTKDAELSDTDRLVCVDLVDDRTGC